MPWPVTINGRLYQAADFAPYAYTVSFPNIMQDVSDLATSVVGAVGTARDLAAAMQAGPVASVQRLGRALTGAVAYDPLDASPVVATKDANLRPTFVPDSGTFSRAATATYFDGIGVLRTAASGAIRLAADPGTGAYLGALLEEARTNLALGSASLSGTGWAALSATMTASALLAPDGTAMRKIVESTANAVHGYRYTFAMTAGATYTVSGYFRAGERSTLTLLATDTSVIASALVDLVAGTAVAGLTGMAATQGIQALGGGLFRVWLNFTATISSSTSYFDFRMAIGAPVGGGAAYTGDGVSGMSTWGWQVEAGAAPSSYIPTTTATVTRAADVLSIPLDATLASLTENTLFVAGRLPVAMASGAVATLLDVSDGSASNRVVIRATATGAVVAIVVVGGVVQAQIGLGSVALGGEARVAVAFRAGLLRGSLNGAAVVGAAPASVPSALTNLRPAADSAGNTMLNGSLSRAALIPRASNDAILLRMAA